MAKKDVSAADWGWVGSLERWAEQAYGEDGLLEEVAARLEQIASTLCEVRRGRPVKHSKRELRSRRPAEEHLLTYGLDGWNRPVEGY